MLRGSEGSANTEYWSTHQTFALQPGRIGAIHDALEQDLGTGGSARSMAGLSGLDNVGSGLISEVVPNQNIL